NPIAARRAIFDFRGDLLEDVFDVRPCAGRTAGHDARAIASAFFATGYASTDVLQALGLDVFGSANRVFEERIAAVDNDVSSFEMRQELLDEFVHGWPGLDHQHHTTRFFQ